MKAIVFAALLPLLISGCATRHPPGPIDFGERPTDYQATIKAYLTTHLKDPESARYTFHREPVRGWANFQGRAYGWATCVGVNAKNSYGGYTGTMQHYFLMRGDAVVRTVAADGTGRAIDALVANLCRS